MAKKLRQSKKGQQHLGPYKEEYSQWIEGSDYPPVLSQHLIDNIYDIVLVSGFPSTRKILISWSEVSEVVLRRLWALEHFPGKTKETGFVQLQEWPQEVLEQPARTCEEIVQEMEPGSFWQATVGGQVATGENEPKRF